MNFFEQELQKIVSRNKQIRNPTFVGSACYGQLSDDLRVKLQFTTLGTSQKYEGIKATILNRKDGSVDQAVFRFSDILGMKQVNSPSYSRRLTPYAWTYDGKTDWYAYHPNQVDYKRLCSEIDAYCSVFQAHEMEPAQKARSVAFEDSPELTME